MKGPRLAPATGNAARRCLVMRRNARGIRLSRLHALETPLGRLYDLSFLAAIASCAKRTIPGLLVIPKDEGTVRRYSQAVGLMPPPARSRRPRGRVCLERGSHRRVS